MEFNFARIPKIIFGAGKLELLSENIRQFGTSIVFLTGSKSFRTSAKYDHLIKIFEKDKIRYYHTQISGEPTPEFVNGLVDDVSNRPVDVVVAIGGGSVIDAGKAVSAMLAKNEKVEKYLEGIGTKTHDGSKIPFIAIPTTAGTGSEATKNAVLSHVGINGYKKSLRHDNFVPDIALIDPVLTLTCPPDVTAACGMDAFTQLLESYVSTAASPMTDVLAYQGITLIKDNLVAAASAKAKSVHVRAAMSYASLLSGITLANAGLGIVHGLASPIGSYYQIPHGVVCGTLVGVATRINVEEMRKNRNKYRPGLEKYTQIGRLVCPDIDGDDDQCCDCLIDHIEQWIDSLRIPKLGDYGVKERDIEKIAQNSGNKYNPVILGEAEINKIIRERL